MNEPNAAVFLDRRRRARFLVRRPAWLFSWHSPLAGRQAENLYREPAEKKSDAGTDFVAPAEIPFFVAALEHASVVHDHGKPSVETHGGEQTRGGSREQLAFLDFAAQLEEDGVRIGAAGRGRGGTAGQLGRRGRRQGAHNAFPFSISY